MDIIERLKILRSGFSYDNFWAGGNAGNALLAESLSEIAVSIEKAGKDIRFGLEALAANEKETTKELITDKE